ncbi:MAG: sugar phosphate isomerase/epimerase family protein [Bacteroidota bacterium]
MNQKIGLFSKIFSGESTDAILEEVSTHGFHHLHINWGILGHSPLPDFIPEEEVAALQKSLSEKNMKVASLSCTYNMTHPDEDIRIAGRKGVEATARVAHLLGNPLLSLCTGTLNPNDKWAYHPGNDSPKAWEAFCGELDILLELAERYDVRLGIEPEYANVIYHTEKAVRLLAAYEGAPLRIIFDLANLVPSGTSDEASEVIYTDILMLFPYTEIVHVKDRTSDGIPTVPGKGFLPLADYVKRWQALDFQGTYIFHGFEKEALSDLKKWIPNHFQLKN